MINNTYDQIKPLLKTPPDNVILHIGANDDPSSTSRVISDNMLSLKSFIENIWP